MEGGDREGGETAFAFRAPLTVGCTTERFGAISTLSVEAWNPTPSDFVERTFGIICKAMSARKIRVFVDTNVLLEYIRGKAELQRLFSEEVRERAAFTINAIVLQELLLARDKNADRIDLTDVVPFLEVLGAGVDLSSPETQAELGELRNRGMHANDAFILAGARSCDVLLTYDDDLLTLGGIATVRSETPEEFLDELDTAA